MIQLYQNQYNFLVLEICESQIDLSAERTESNREESQYPALVTEISLLTQALNETNNGKLNIVRVTKVFKLLLRQSQYYFDSSVDNLIQYCNTIL